MKILIAEKVAVAGVEIFKRQESWTTIQSTPKEYQQHLADADALIVRSAVQVTPEVLAKAPKLRVIGRAGVGVDNVDLDAATAAGVLVMNTPGGNAVSVAEHTLALMLGMARQIPKANSTTKAGKWEKKALTGSELRGKTLGIVGLGSIGREVVKRARGFEMRILAHDPYVTTQIARDLDINLVALNELFAQSDYITLHLSLTPETQGIVGKEAFAKMKDGVRIVNCARGELIDDEALMAALKSGKVAGAALDAFSIEPPPQDFPLFELEQVIGTPHIGGSTEEAQEIVGVRIAEQVAEYLRSGIAINAVNMTAVSPEQYRTIGPYISLAEQLGNFAAHIASGNPKTVKLGYIGKLAEMNTSLIRSAALAGLLARSTAKTNLINAMQVASQRGWEVAEKHESRSTFTDSVQVALETDSGSALVEGAYLLGKPRLVRVDDIYIEAPLEGYVIFLKNHDVPGVIGHVGQVLGRNGINIANFSLGRKDAPAKPGDPLEAVSVVTTDQAVPETVLTQLLENPAITTARLVQVS
jgi:D-3-phosphoglycerate dehydrogenase